uniref:RBR-type E3 ubiquitin transferase n=1 Tax=Coccidioides posadasii RMSCC 3488 TaxID=454284 RepID=A0A0J6IA56_COCPO|nr:RING finger protein [Coccidioides posadasii RMSCC 3488]
MASVPEPEIDQPTADLIVQLQLQDADLYFESAKGKSREPTDEELAFQLQTEEFKNASQFFVDRRMAMSFATAVQVDGPILVDNFVTEDNAMRDRELARYCEENGSPVAAAKDRQSNSEPIALDDETLYKLQILYVTGPGGHCPISGVETTSSESDEAESSTWAARRTHQGPPSMRRCVACREETEFVRVARVPCGHEYCRSCLEDLFKASMKDESLFPPRCCRQPIVINIARIFLTNDLVQRCNAFIDASHIEGEVATCPECGSTTCTSCKGRAHTGDCPNDTAMQQLLSTAQDNGWQRCYSCWRVVELDHGCNHMTCRCGAQFCYNCGERWKDCACEQWNEHRLLARAYQIIDREQNIPLDAAPQDPDDRQPEINESQLDINGAEPETHELQPDQGPQATVTPEQGRHATFGQTAREILVARTMQELRENHECSHVRWNYMGALIIGAQEPQNFANMDTSKEKMHRVAPVTGSTQEG